MVSLRSFVRRLVASRAEPEPWLAADCNSSPPRETAPPPNSKKTFLWCSHHKSSFSATFCALFPYPTRFEKCTSAKNGRFGQGKTGPHGVIEACIELRRRASFEPPPAYNDALVLVVFQQVFWTCKNAAGAFWQAAHPLFIAAKPHRPTQLLRRYAPTSQPASGNVF